MANKTCKISRTQEFNQDVRSYHFNIPVSETSIQNFWRPIRSSSEKHLRDVGLLGEKIVRSLFEIEGVVEVFIEPYEVTVEKAPLFLWDGRIGIKRQVVAAIRKAFGETTVRADWTLTASRRRSRVQAPNKATN